MVVDEKAANVTPVEQVPVALVDVREPVAGGDQLSSFSIPARYRSSIRGISSNGFPPRKLRPAPRAYPQQCGLHGYTR